jgi:hypothetical protein
MTPHNKHLESATHFTIFSMSLSIWRDKTLWTLALITSSGKNMETTLLSPFPGSSSYLRFRDDVFCGVRYLLTRCSVSSSTLTQVDTQKHIQFVSEPVTTHNSSSWSCNTYLSIQFRTTNELNSSVYYDKLDYMAKRKLQITMHLLHKYQSFVPWKKQASTALSQPRQFIVNEKNTCFLQYVKLIWSYSVGYFICSTICIFSLCWFSNSLMQCQIGETSVIPV